jgi:hypothetical protein
MQSDRFARKIACILVFSYAARLRRLMRNPLGRSLDSPLRDQSGFRRIRFVFCAPVGR